MLLSLSLSHAEDNHRLYLSTVELIGDDRRKNGADTSPPCHLPADCSSSSCSLLRRIDSDLASVWIPSPRFHTRKHTRLSALSLVSRRVPPFYSLHRRERRKLYDLRRYIYIYTRIGVCRIVDTLLLLLLLLLFLVFLFLFNSFKYSASLRFVRHDTLEGLAWIYPWKRGKTSKDFDRRPRDNRRYYDGGSRYVGSTNGIPHARPVTVSPCLSRTNLYANVSNRRVRRTVSVSINRETLAKWIAVPSFDRARQNLSKLVSTRKRNVYKQLGRELFLPPRKPETNARRLCAEWPCNNFLSVISAGNLSRARTLN